MLDAYEMQLNAEIAEGEALIERQRNRIDVLREALEMYQKAKPQVRPKRERKRIADSKRSQASVVLELLKAAGPEGMTYKQLIDGAAAKDVTLKNTSLRSLIWMAKEAGDVEAIKPGLFRFASDQNEEPPEAEASDGSESSPRGDDHSREASPYSSLV
jgi:hypothetical protein